MTLGDFCKTYVEEGFMFIGFIDKTGWFFMGKNASMEEMKEVAFFQTYQDNIVHRFYLYSNYGKNGIAVMLESK